MKNFAYLLRHEVRMLFLSPAMYIAAVIFMGLMSFLYIILLENLSAGPQESLASTDFFRVFWIPVFFMVPLLTMRLIAEEHRMGTLESLLATPIGAFGVVTAKFLAAYLFYLLIWGMTLTFPWLVAMVLGNGSLESLSDTASLLGGYTFIGLSGLLYIAIGVFSSSLTRSQLVAGMFTFTLLFLVIVGCRLLHDVPAFDSGLLSWASGGISYLQTFDHLEDFSRGIIDSRPFFFYISNAILVLGITTIIVEGKTQ